jgi:hypothetical protein
MHAENAPRNTRMYYCLLCNFLIVERYSKFEQCSCGCGIAARRAPSCLRGRRATERLRWWTHGRLNDGARDLSRHGAIDWVFKDLVDRLHNPKLCTKVSAESRKAGKRRRRAPTAWALARKASAAYAKSTRMAAGCSAPQVRRGRRQTGVH